MTAFLWAACLFVAAVWAAVITYLWRTRDRKPLSVPGRDAPESPAATGPAAADPQWQRDGEPGIPAGGSTWHTCRHGWPGRTCGQAHPYIVEPQSVPADPEDVPPGDTAVPGPASLPEGDEPAARPPQEAPAREPSPDPLTAARNAMAAVARLEPGEYLEHLEHDTGYADDGSLWNWVSDETRARGIPVFKDEVA